MSDDWQVGDLALCLDTNCGGHQGQSYNRETISGRIYRVEWVVPREHNWTWACPCGLRLEGVAHQSRSGCCGARFRKIRPDAHEACEAEFVTLIKRAKQPSKVGA